MHAVVSARQAPTQLPPVQVWPAVQRRPHVPQLFGSLLVSVLPRHAPSTQPPPVHVRVSVPQVPHGAVIISPGVHAMHAPVVSHAHVSLHVRSWNWPEGQPVLDVEWEPGAHSPSPLHAPAGIHWQLVLQCAACVPQFPQSVEPTSPGMHAPSFMHTP